MTLAVPSGAQSITPTPTSPPPAQVWVTVASESDRATLPPSTVWRYGTDIGTTAAGVDCSAAPGCWSPVSSDPLDHALDYNSGLFSFPDPAHGVVKKLQVAEQVVAQTVTVNGNPVAVPALPAPPTYPPFTFVPGNVVQITYAGVQIQPGSPLAALMNGGPPLLPPYEMIGLTLQNFTYKLIVTDLFTKQTTTFDCMFGMMALDGTVSQNCIAEPVPGR